MKKKKSTRTNPESRTSTTIRMPDDLCEAYRREAIRQGIGYQTLMQMMLRKASEYFR